jgi:hypothetical protein
MLWMFKSIPSPGSYRRRSGPPGFAAKSLQVTALISLNTDLKDIANLSAAERFTTRLRMEFINTEEYHVEMGHQQESRTSTTELHRFVASAPLDNVALA